MKILLSFHIFFAVLILTADVYAKKFKEALLFSIFAFKLRYIVSKYFVVFVVFCLKNLEHK